MGFPERFCVKHFLRPPSLPLAHAPAEMHVSLIAHLGSRSGSLCEVRLLCTKYAKTPKGFGRSEGRSNLDRIAFAGQYQFELSRISLVEIGLRFFEHAHRRQVIVRRFMMRQYETLHLPGDGAVDGDDH